MKFSRNVMILGLAVALCGNALADGGRGHDRWRPHEFRGNGGDWVAPLIFVGIAGAMLGAAATQNRTQAPVVQPVQPMPLAPPANAQYYCRSVGQYYPYTQFCPEGWQVVTPGY